MRIYFLSWAGVIIRGYTIKYIPMTIYRQLFFFFFRPKGKYEQLKNIVTNKTVSLSQCSFLSKTVMWFSQNVTGVQWEFCLSE